MIIPQMEICSFHFQKMLEVLLLCTKLRVERILKDEAEESQEKEFLSLLKKMSWPNLFNFIFCLFFTFWPLGM